MFEKLELVRYSVYTEIAHLHDVATRLAPLNRFEFFGHRTHPYY